MTAQYFSAVRLYSATESGSCLISFQIHPHGTLHSRYFHLVFRVTSTPPLRKSMDISGVPSALHLTLQFAISTGSLFAGWYALFHFRNPLLPNGSPGLCVEPANCTR